MYSSTITGFNILGYSPVAPLYLSGFGRSLTGSHASWYDGGVGSGSQWTMSTVQHVEYYLGNGYVTGYWSDGKNYQDAAASKFSFYVR